MATWTDSRFKDFLRHPIGYMSGERESDLAEDKLAQEVLECEGDRFLLSAEASFAMYKHDVARAIAFVDAGADIHFHCAAFSSPFSLADNDEALKLVDALSPQKRLDHAVITRDLDQFKQAVESGADVFQEIDPDTAYSFLAKPEHAAPDTVLARSVAEFVKQQEQDILEFEESGIDVGGDRIEFTKGALEVMGQSMGHSTQQALFDGAHLSPEAADIYKASLSRNVQDTNDALDRIGGQAEPEQQAYNKQADPLDLKLDRAGEAAYQQTLRTNGKAMTDSIATKAQADPAKLAAAWSSTQPTKENLEAVKPAHVAPALAPSRRPKI